MCSQIWTAPLRNQSWAVSAVFTNMLGLGMMLSYPTSLLPALKDPESPIRADLNTVSWLSSSIGVAGIPGFLMSSVLMDLHGRKIAHGLVILPGTIGWLLISFAANVPTLMVGRVLGGMTTGASVSLGAVVIGEYSSPKHRGMFLNLKTAAVCMGGMSVHILGNFFHWRTVAMAAAVPHILAILITFTWPESPSWLAGRQEFAKCEASFYRLRGRDEASELEDLIEAQMVRSKHSKEKNCMQSVVEFFKKFTKKDFVKPLFITINSTILLETCGRHIFPAYALQIIEEITGSKTQSLYFTLAIDIIITASAVSSSVLVRMMKRRTLLFSTGFAAFFVLMTVCTYLFLGAKGTISKDSSIPIGLFVVYFILANLGCTPIPLALLGELYPLAHRAAGSAMSGIVMSLFLMVALHLTPHLLVSIKVHGTFGFYGIAMGISLVILYFTLPETKDRTLQEIEDYFNYGSFREKVDDDEDVKTEMVL